MQKLLGFFWFFSIY